MSDENKPSEMIRVPTPLIPAVRELSRLHRQGRTSEVLQGLDELILALDSSSDSTYNATVDMYKQHHHSEEFGHICNIILMIKD